MKTPEPNERLHRFIDEAMNDAERVTFATEVEQNPALADEFAKLKLVSGMIRDHVAVERPVPNADFFNSQIQERIAAEQRATRRTQERRSGAAWLGWFFKPWALAGAAAVVALGIFGSRQLSPSLKTEIVHTYTPDPSVRATSIYNSGADATVITLDGLAVMPDDHEITALRVHHSESDPELAATTFYDAAGNVLLVLNSDTVAL